MNTTLPEFRPVMWGCHLLIVDKFFGVSIRFYWEFPWREVTPPDNIELAVAAPYLAIVSIPAALTRASQDVSALPVGPHTGEIPATLLKELGVKYSLIGHSERRRELHETNLEVEAKMKQAIDTKIMPIICAQTIDEIPANIRNYSEEDYLIMYEPAAAISSDGNYHPESPDKINAVLVDWQTKLNLKCRLLYGGSVNPDDCQSIIKNCPLVSGFVVGHASLNEPEFSSIIDRCQKSLASNVAS